MDQPQHGMLRVGDQPRVAFPTLSVLDKLSQQSAIVCRMWTAQHGCAPVIEVQSVFGILECWSRLAELEADRSPAAGNIYR